MASSAAANDIVVLGLRRTLVASSPVAAAAHPLVAGAALSPGCCSSSSMRGSGRGCRGTAGAVVTARAATRGRRGAQPQTSAALASARRPGPAAGEAAAWASVAATRRAAAGIHDRPASGRFRRATRARRGPDPLELAQVSVLRIHQAQLQRPHLDLVPVREALHRHHDSVRRGCRSSTPGRAAPPRSRSA